MKKISIHIYIVLAICILGFILGSFLDLQLMEAVFSERNTFGLIISVLGTIPGYGCLAICGGGLFAIALLKKEYKMPYRVIFYGVAAAGVGLAIFFIGREFFGPNGFYWIGVSKWIGYLIAIPICLPLGYLGYRLGKSSDNNNLWLLIFVMMIAIFLALVPGVTALKALFHRPRYREVVRLGYADFHNWWQRCSNYKDIMEINHIGKDEFKSFPSGHGGASAVFMLCVVFLPLVNSKYEKIQLPLFYGGLAWTLLVCFSRILVGAHFLSDVSMGTLLTVIFMIVAYYVVMKGKVGLPKEQVASEETVQEESL